jgi:hypothetical protein
MVITEWYAKGRGKSSFNWRVADLSCKLSWISFCYRKNGALDMQKSTI